MVFQQTCPSLHRVRSCTVVNSRRPESQCHPLNFVRFVFRGDSGSQQLFMYFAMMHFAKWRFQLRVVMLVRSVVLLDTKNTRRNRDSTALPLLLSRLAPRRADWPLISHTAPPLNARYKLNSAISGSDALIVRASVSSPKPPIFTFRHFARAVVSPR